MCYSELLYLEEKHTYIFVNRIERIMHFCKNEGQLFQ